MPVGGAEPALSAALFCRARRGRRLFPRSRDTAAGRRSPGRGGEPPSYPFPGYGGRGVPGQNKKKRYQPRPAPGSPPKGKKMPAGLWKKHGGAGTQKRGRCDTAAAFYVLFYAARPRLAARPAGKGEKRFPCFPAANRPHLRWAKGSKDPLAVFSAGRKRTPPKSAQGKPAAPALGEKRSAALTAGAHRPFQFSASRLIQVRTACHSASSQSASTAVAAMPLTPRFRAR